MGIRHAMDADHVIAVSTMVAIYKNPIKAAIIGAYWGLGHTSTLFIIGLVVLLLKISVDAKITIFMELAVGLMLIFLGIKSLLEKTQAYHQHAHKHEYTEHNHIHSHFEIKKKRSHHESFVIGSIHGIAGSGALMLLVLSTVKSLPAGLIYILIFGLGSIGSMTLISLALSLPYIFTFKKFPGMHKYLMRITGILSVVFGFIIMYEIFSLIF